MVKTNQTSTQNDSNDVQTSKRIQIVKEVVTQTDDVPHIPRKKHQTISRDELCRQMDYSNYISTDFLLKLINTINEAFQKKVQNESNEIRKNILYSCFKNNFNLPVLNQARSETLPTMNVEYSSESENEVLSQDSVTGSMISATTTGTTRFAPSTSRRNQAKRKCATGGNYVKKKKI